MTISLGSGRCARPLMPAVLPTTSTEAKLAQESRAGARRPRAIAAQLGLQAGAGGAGGGGGPGSSCNSSMLSWAWTQAKHFVLCCPGHGNRSRRRRPSLQGERSTKRGCCPGLGAFSSTRALASTERAHPLSISRVSRSLLLQVAPPPLPDMTQEQL